MTIDALSSSGSSHARIQISPGDSETLSGHQVELSHGTNLILISVYLSGLDQVLRPYSLAITKAGSAPDGAATNIRISGAGWAKEGSTIPFLLTRTGDTTRALTVPVDVTEKADMLPSLSKGRFNVEFQAGYASARLDVPTNSDSLYQGSSRVKAALVDGEGYSLDFLIAPAQTLVVDDDYRKPNLASLALVDQQGNTMDIGAFAPDTRTYSAGVESEIEWITISAETTYFSPFFARILPPDSRTSEPGHQVDLSHGVNLITIAVIPDIRLSDTPAIGTYEVRINRAGSTSGDSLPTISIYGLNRSFEGSTMPFVLTRTGDTSQALTVTVNVSETGGEMVPSSSQGRFNLEFPAGNASVRFDVATNADHEWEEHSTLTVALVDSDAYEVSSESGSASSEIKDNDVPRVTATFTVDSTQVEEGGVVTANVVVKTDGPKQPHGFVANLRFTTEVGTAQEEDIEWPSPRDWLGFSYGYNPNDDGTYDRSVGLDITVNSQTMQPVESNGVVPEFKREFSIPISISNDDRAEADETFNILVDWETEYLPAHRIQTLDQNINSHTITIMEHEETPETPDPVSHITVEIADSGSAGSTYTITWNDAGECTSDYNAYLASRSTAYHSTFHNSWTGVIETQKWTRSQTLGSTGHQNTQITKTLDSFPLKDQHIVQVYCGDRWRLIGEVPLPSKTENSVERPVAGTYSSEPALTGLTVAPGTLGPAFASYGFLYAVLDVPHDRNQITF